MMSACNALEARIPLQPFVDPRVFMSGVIVGNNVDVEIGWALLIDQFERRAIPDAGGAPQDG
jgi:hypothetical protein